MLAPPPLKEDFLEGLPNSSSFDLDFDPRLTLPELLLPKKAKQIAFGLLHADL